MKYINPLQRERGGRMMFVAGGKLINFDSVDYVDLYTGENACVGWDRSVQHQLVYFYHRDTGTREAGETQYPYRASDQAGAER